MQTVFHSLEQLCVRRQFMVATRLAKGSVVAYKHAHLVSFVMQLTCAIQVYSSNQSTTVEISLPFRHLSHHN